MGNSIGIVAHGGSCGSHRWLAFRNQVGMMADTVQLSNLLAVENGIGFTPVEVSKFGAFKIWPYVEAKTRVDKTGHIRFFEKLTDSVIVGVSEIESACESWMKNSSYWKIGHSLTRYEHYVDYDYTGIAIGNDRDTLKGSVDGPTTCGIDFKIKHWSMERVHFVGFSGKDACGRTNVAISNEKAAYGEELQPRWTFPGGQPTWEEVFGSRYCMPVTVSGLTWTDVDARARLRFSSGSRGLTHVDNGYQHCFINDDDGTLIGSGSPSVALSGVQRHWPERRTKDCQKYVNNGYQLEGENEYSACEWWMRQNPVILDAAFFPWRQGSILAQSEIQTRDGFSCATQPWQFDGQTDNNVLSCTGVDLTFVLMKFPVRMVSGSRMKWGPMGIANARKVTAGTAALYADLTSTALYEQNSVVAKNLNEPHYFHVPNRGYYRLYFSGDLGAILDQEDPKGRMHFSLPFSGSGLMPRAAGVSEYAVILSIRLSIPNELNFFYLAGPGEGGSVGSAPRPVTPVFNERALTFSKQSGSFYRNLRTLTTTFLLSGTGVVSFRTLKVVQVLMGLAVTFDTFFAENNVDPSALHPSFPVAESVKSDWDPDFGAIVKQDPFVRNIAAVLGINPGRIRVTNIVPGDGRRLLDGSTSGLSCAFTLAEDQSAEGEGRRLAGLSSMADLNNIADSLIAAASSGNLDPATR